MTDRIKLEVWVNLDPIPGTFHSKESAANIISALLNSSIPHYKPTVSTTNEQNHYSDN